MITLPSIAVQLYSVRELLKDDLPGVVSRIAAMGYAGVEPFGLDAESARAQAAVFADLGLQVPSMHGELPLGDQQEAVLDIMDTVGTRRVFVSRGPDSFQTPEGIRQVCADLNAASAIAARRGCTVGYHNHWWEFETVSGTGRTGFDLMLDLLDPAVLLQIDTYWVRTAGHDPAAVVRQVNRRAPALHIKDGPAVLDQPMLAVGDGVLDFPAVIAAAEGRAEWLIVELDHCATDILEAVRRSYDYLSGKGLGRGR